MGIPFNAKEVLEMAIKAEQNGAAYYRKAAQLHSDEHVFLTRLAEMEDKEIKDTLFNSEYFYLIDRDILEVYLNNNEVFDTVVNDIMKDKWNYETNLRTHTK